MKRAYLFGALLCACIAAAPLFLDSGFLNTRAGGDSPFLLFRLHQMTAALSDGVFPVRWMPDAALGLGYPFFNFYGGLPFYAGAGLRLLGFSYVLCLKLLAIIGFLLAAGGMFAWVEALTARREAALLAAALYTFLPYHMVNVYVRGDSLNEFWAMGFFPWILFALYRAAQHPTRRRLAWVAASYAALALTHNISALIFSPFVAGYALLCAFRPDWRAAGGRVGWLAAAGLLGLMLSAWFWLPALAEQDTVQLDDQTTGYFAYTNHFRNSDTLIQGDFFVDDNAVDGNPFSMGLLQTILFAFGGAGFLLSVSQSRRYGGAAFLSLGFAAAMLMLLPASRPIWEAIPLLPFTQFPWRWLGIQGFFGAALSGIGLDFFIRRAVGARGRAALFLNVTLIGIVGLSALGRLTTDFIPLRDEDVTAERLMWYEAFSGNLGTTIRHEYLPRWTVPRPYSSERLLGDDPRAKFLSGSGEATQQTHDSNSQTWVIRVEGEAATIALPTLYWPGWSASVNGETLPLSPAEGLGYIQMTLPPGQHRVSLSLNSTPLRFSAEAVSGLGVLVWLGLLFMPRKRGRADAIYRVPTPTMRLPARQWVAGCITLYAALISYDSLMQPGAEGALTANFDTTPYFHPAADPIPASETLLSPPPQTLFLGAAPGGNTPGLYFPRVAESNVHFAPIVQRGETPPTLTDAPIQFDRLALAEAILAPQVDSLTLTLWWEVLAELPQNYGIDLRLLDEVGNEWAALSTIAGGAGLYPSGLWRTGDTVPDSYRLERPYGLPPGVYRLRFNLFDPRTLQPVYQGEWAGLSQPDLSLYACGEIGYGAEAVFTLSELESAAQIGQGESLPVRMAWRVQETPGENYRLRWTLDGTNEPVQTWETPLAPGSDTTDWRVPAGECGGYIEARHRLDIPKRLPPGDYTLRYQLLNQRGDILGEAVSVGAVRVTGVERVYTPPELAAQIEADFGDSLRLWGYEILQENGQLHIRLVWGATREPSTDYTYYVHLYDEAGSVARQLDTMPRAYTYPTSLWDSGEIVVETVTLDMSGLPAGIYRVGVGWYDPLTQNRLPLSAPETEVTIQENTLIFPEEVRLP